MCQSFTGLAIYFFVIIKCICKVNIFQTTVYLTKCLKMSIKNFPQTLPASLSFIPLGSLTCTTIIKCVTKTKLSNYFLTIKSMDCVCDKYGLIT